MSSLFLVLLASTIGETAGDSSAPEAPAIGGRKTGFFHLEEKGGVSWLVDPDGKLFISKGVNHITYQGDRSPALGRSPYGETVAARHGSAGAYAKAAAKRLEGWGFNTVGAWSSRELERTGLAYTVNLDLGSAGGGDWQKGRFPDVFAENFKRAVEKIAAERCSARKDDPRLLGYFTDNELRWGADWRSKKGLFPDFLALPDGAAGRAEALRHLEERYGSVEKLNTAFGTSLDSFAEARDLKDEKELSALEAGWVRKVARRYFQVCAAAVRKADPHHLILGCRFAGYAPKEVLESLGDSVDLVSWNNYDLTLPVKKLEEIHASTLKPLMLTEFSFKALDSGLPNTRGAGKALQTQEERAERYEAYVTALLALPYAVGFHWFQHGDEPAEGRFDGENSNYGLVDIKDEPWKVLTERAREVNGRLEAIHAASAKRRAEIFVAPGGDDAGPGTKEKPFRTLERARDALRALRKNAGASPDGGATVWIGAGLYPLERTLELTGEDSGSPGAPVIYRAIEGAETRFSGGRALRDFHSVTDPEILARLDEKARGKILVADLKAAGINDAGRLRSRGFGRATVPAHLELFHRGRPMTLARWPNEGYEKIGAPGEADPAGDGHGGSLGKLEKGFHYEGDRPSRWKSLEGLWVHGYWAWDWANSYEEVAALDREKKLILTRPPHGLYGIRKGQRFYFLNVLEELDSPGEYYVDGARGLIYFWPPEPVESEVASLLEGPLVSLRSASWITLRGLTLEGGRGSGVKVEGGEGVLVAGCRLRNLGDWAVEITGGKGHGVAGCEIEGTGDGGVSLSGGDRATLEPSGHFVENNHLHHLARWSRCYQPAVLIAGVGTRVSHNLIHDHPHCPILFTGNEHRIEFNEIHHVCLETGDVGAIYTGRDWTYRGNLIEHNFIHHTGGVGMGSMGVYLDDCVSGEIVRGNVFYQVQRAAFIGGGRDIVVENNVFIDCTPAVQIDGRGLDRSPVWHDMVYDTMKKGLEAMRPNDPPYRDRYPELQRLEPYYAKTDGVPPEGNRVQRNISIGGKWLEAGWHAKPEWLDLKDNLVGEDPRFVDREKMNFQLKDDSPAWKLGFKRIPFEEIGLMKDEYGRVK